MVNFDIVSYLNDLKACKPPYPCPVDGCGRVYKSYLGIVAHLDQAHGFSVDEDGKVSNLDHSGSLADKKNGLSAVDSAATNIVPRPFFSSPVVDSLTFDELANSFTFEADGGLHTLPLNETIKIVDRSSWEESVKMAKEADDVGTTPNKKMALSNIDVRRVSVTPKYSTPKGSRRRRPMPMKHRAVCTPNQPADQTGHQSTEADVSSLNPQLQSEKCKPVKFAEARFSELSSYAGRPEESAVMSNNYVKYVEPSSGDLDGKVEYDVDEEDMAWLSLINRRRRRDQLKPVTEDQLELLIDRLEKESYFYVQTGSSKDSESALVAAAASSATEDDAVCCVCMDGECSNTNVILFCDLCNLAVHQECYGVPYIPEGQWLCRRCLQSPSRSVDCCLCPNKGGAFKQTDDGRWAHVVCGLWIPEVRFANTVFLEPIDSIENIPAARWKLSCRVCKQRNVGACIQCHKTNCYTAFHVTCGLLSGLHMKMDTVRESMSAGHVSVTVRKTAFCDVHTPSDSDCKPELDNVVSLGINIHASATKTNACTNERDGVEVGSNSPPLPIQFRGLMNFSPQCPWQKVQEIASLVDVQKKNHFFQRLLSYWTLKRQMRNGVPLIRRLQFAKATDYKSLESVPVIAEQDLPKQVTKNVKEQLKKMQKIRSGSPKVSVCTSEPVDLDQMRNERRLMRHLRHDLERVRLLCELLRKREQRKRELVINYCEAVDLRCMPWILLLRDVVDSLEEIDISRIFATPVDLKDVPDYLDHIAHPMDLETIRSKVDSFQYVSVNSLETDFNLMVNNCLTYNEKDTIFYKNALKMRDHGGSVLRQAKRLAAEYQFDTTTGLHMARPTSKKESQELNKSMSLNDRRRQDMQVCRSVDKFFADNIWTDGKDDDSQPDEPVANLSSCPDTDGGVGCDGNDEFAPTIPVEGPESLLNGLLELLDLVRPMRKSAARTKRLKMIQGALVRTRNRLFCLKNEEKHVVTNQSEREAEETPLKSRRPRSCRLTSALDSK